MRTWILRLIPTPHQVLKFHNSCPGRLTWIGAPRPFGSLQRHWKSNLGLMQGQSVPPAGFHFAGLCIACYELIALVRNRPLGNGNRAFQTCVAEVGANRNGIKSVSGRQKLQHSVAEAHQRGRGQRKLCNLLALLFQQPGVIDQGQDEQGFAGRRGDRALGQLIGSGL